MEVVRVTPDEEARFAGWHAALHAGASAGRTDPPIWTLAELRVSFGRQQTSYLREAYAAVDAGAVVGAAFFEAPLRDNLTYLDLDVCVPRPHRGRGVGAALYERLAERATELGRTTLGAEIHQPFDAPPVPGIAFAAKRQFTRRMTEERRILGLPVGEETLVRLWDQAHLAAADYLIRSWQGPCPQQYAPQYAQLKSLLASEAPSGDLEYEPHVWDVDRLREHEQQVAAKNWVVLTAVAIAPDGTLAGHTQIGVPLAEGDRAHQWDTLVLPEHRGHRLGLALKVSNLRVLVERFPRVRRISTYNAPDNAPMVAVNEALGFLPVERLEEWQRVS